MIWVRNTDASASTSFATTFSDGGGCGGGGAGKFDMTGMRL